jgi:hypothetical protein
MYEPQGPYLDTKGAAEYCSIPVATLIDYRQRGLLPRFFRVGSRLIRYAVKDLDEFMRSRTVTALKQAVGEDAGAALGAEQ